MANRGWLSGRVRRLLGAVAVACLAVTAAPAVAAGAAGAAVITLEDVHGVVGDVNVQTGHVTIVGASGVALTDIARCPNGRLYGLTFTRFYRLNPTTGKATLVGAHGIPAGNALVCGAHNVLLAAGNASTDLYRINSRTGRAANLGSIGAASSGDLAWVGSTLYLSSTASQLVRVSYPNPGHSRVVGRFGWSNVYGLVAVGRVLYGVSGTTILRVSTSSGHATKLSNYRGHGLGTCYGATVS